MSFICLIEIGHKKAVKYLGITLDCRHNYWAQIQHATTNAAKLTGMLNSLMANIGGPTTQANRKLIIAATNSILLYGNMIWGDALKIKSKPKILAAMQRTAALRVSSAYHSVSSAAVLVIVREIPINLLAFERRRSWKMKS